MTTRQAGVKTTGYDEGWVCGHYVRQQGDQPHVSQRLTVRQRLAGSVWRLTTAVRGGVSSRHE